MQASVCFDYKWVAEAAVESVWFSVAAIMLEKADFGLASKTKGLSNSMTWKSNQMLPWLISMESSSSELLK